MATTSDRWHIPNSIAQLVMERDKACVYCRSAMIEYAPLGQSRSRVASWEHIDNDVRNITEHNICLCCCSCNSSKGSRSLSDWFATDYCVQREINAATVAEVVRRYLATREDSMSR